MRSVYVLLLMLVFSCSTSPADNPATRPLDFKGLTLNMPIDTVRSREGFDDVGSFTCMYQGIEGQAKTRFAAGRLVNLSYIVYNPKPSDDDTIRKYLVARYGSTKISDGTLSWIRNNSRLYAALSDTSIYIDLSREASPK